MVLREPNAINKYFANIAFKDMYDPSELHHFRCDKSGDFQPLTNIEVEQLLRNTKLTAAGCDDIPTWLLMYKTAVYTLVNGASTHQKPQI